MGSIYPLSRGTVNVCSVFHGLQRVWKWMKSERSAGKTVHVSWKIDPSGSKQFLRVNILAGWSGAGKFDKSLKKKDNGRRAYPSTAMCHPKTDATVFLAIRQHPLEHPLEHRRWGHHNNRLCIIHAALSAAFVFPCITCLYCHSTLSLNWKLTAQVYTAKENPPTYQLHSPLNKLPVFLFAPLDAERSRTAPHPHPIPIQLLNNFYSPWFIPQLFYCETAGKLR